MGLVETVAPPTRMIADLVDRAGHLKNHTRILVADSNEVHQFTAEFHAETLAELHRTMTQDRAKESVSALLDVLSGLGFSWRDIARMAGVSVPAVRKWRNGAPATGENRKRAAMVVALCDLAHDPYLIDDVAGWIETPLHGDAPITVVDLVAQDRFDLALELASDHGTDPESILDRFDPEWRTRYDTPVEVFTAADGLPGLRLREDAS